MITPSSHRWVGLVGLFTAILIFMSGCGGGGSNSVAVQEPPPPNPSPFATQAQINSKYNLAPNSRTVTPLKIFKSSGTMGDANSILQGQPVRLKGNGSFISFDFGKEVGGIVALTFAATSDGQQRVGLAFSESSLYVAFESDGKPTDGALYSNVAGAGSYTMPIDNQRGGFRYVTVFLASDGWVDVSKVSVQFLLAPGMSNPQAYAGYFYCSDDLLNRIWYAGAYTVQLNTIDPSQGRTWPPPQSGWQNDGVLGSGASVLVDGAKRDRNIWAGDLAIALPTAFVSTGDTASARNTLNALYDQQQIDGELPYSGPSSNTFGSDTYHLWTLIASADYYLFSDDKEWLDSHWSQYKTAVQYSLNKIDSNGVLNVDQHWDWGRMANSTGEVMEANALLYRVLVTAAELAEIESDTSAQTSYTVAAQNLKTSINILLWDASVAGFRNDPASTLFPQDGNATAVWYGVTDSATKNTSISKLLQNNWNSFGARTPEKPYAIAPFVGAMEANAHFVAGNDKVALDLIRLEWGYMLNSPIGTGSTFWEGYLEDGSLFPTTPDGIPWYAGPDELGPFMSLAHGWSSGPTSALTFFVLGITPVLSGTESFNLIPHLGDLTHAEGDITLHNGEIKASWTRDTAAGTFTETVISPSGVTGTVGIPTFQHPAMVHLDNQLVWNNCNGQQVNSQGASSDGTYIYFKELAGTHVLSSSTCP